MLFSYLPFGKPGSNERLLSGTLSEYRHLRALRDCQSVLSQCKMSSGVPLTYPLGSEFEGDDNFNVQVRPVANGQDFRSNVSVTIRLTTPICTATSNAISFTKEGNKCKEYIIVHRSCNFRALCTRLTTCCAAGKRGINGKTMVTFTKDANGDANCRLRCRVEGGNGPVGPC